MPYYPRRRSTRPRRAVRRRRIARKRIGVKKLHAVKKFVSTHKYLDVYSAPAGTSAGGWARHNLHVSCNMSPLQAALGSMYKQFMITGVAWQYRTTNSSPNQDAGEYATQLMFVEDKDSLNAITVSQAQSQDNVRNLTTDKNFKHYIRMPRPALYQTDGVGTPVFATQGARFGTWLTFNEVNIAIKHLNAQFLIQDSPSAVVAAPGVKQGELWVKIYLAVKEQCLN